MYMRKGINFTSVAVIGRLDVENVPILRFLNVFTPTYAIVCAWP